jgi:hypothetical protein
VALVNSMCPTTCGGAGQACCQNGPTACIAPLACTNNQVCAMCGAAGQTCCANDMCNAGLTCKHPGSICG